MHNDRGLQVYTLLLSNVLFNFQNSGSWESYLQLVLTEGKINGTHSGHRTANIYLFKVNSINTRKSCETCSELTIKTPERRH